MESFKSQTKALWITASMLEQRGQSELVKERFLILCICKLQTVRSGPKETSMQAIGAT